MIGFGNNVCEHCGIRHPSSYDCVAVRKQSDADMREAIAAIPDADGWVHTDGPRGDGDSRKLVTLEEDGMVWVGVRAFNQNTRIWQNNNVPERARVIAWRDMPQPAKDYTEKTKDQPSPSPSPDRAGERNAVLEEAAQIVLYGDTGGWNNNLGMARTMLARSIRALKS